jgi:hypothetical protein
MFWLHLNDHWCFFSFNFRWFYFTKGNHVCLKENAVPICPDTELSWCRTVFFNGWRNVLVPNCLFQRVAKCLGAELSCFQIPEIKNRNRTQLKIFLSQWETRSAIWKCPPEKTNKQTNKQTIKIQTNKQKTKQK